MPPKTAIRIMAIDTSNARGSVALLQGPEVVAQLHIFSLETHSARLLRTAEFLLQSIQWSLGDLELIAVGNGPGSFTGIRIGVATALGLAQSLQIPFAGISCLDALASRAAMLEGTIGAVMDAQRAQVYYAEYESRSGKVRSTERPVLCFPTALGKRMRGRHVHLVGDGAIRYSQELGIGTSKWPRLATIDLFLAADIGKLALARKRGWRTGRFLRSHPLYIRRPDALKPKARGPR